MRQNTIYAKLAIKCSNRYNDNLNTYVEKLAINLLRDINGCKKNNASSLFTLSELILFSNKDKIVVDKYENKKKILKILKSQKPLKNKKHIKVPV